MESFRFEHHHKFTEDEYLRIMRLEDVRPWRKPLRFAPVILAFLLLLWWTPTRGLAIVLIALSAVALYMPRLLPGTQARQFRQHKYLADDLTYGISPEKAWVAGSHLRCEADWSLFLRATPRGEWLILSFAGLPNLFFPYGELRRDVQWSMLQAHLERHGARLPAAAV